MFGFVSALSSTISIMIVVMTVFFASFMLNMTSEELIELGYTEFEEKSEGSKGEGANDVTEEGGILKHASAILENEYLDSTETIEITCTYGNNFSYDVASKTSVLFYLLLKKKSNAPIDKPQVTFSPDEVNKCKVK